MSTKNEPQPFDICSECIHWAPVAPAGPVTIGAPRLGVCFGAPPQVVPMVDPKSGQIIGGQTMRPQTTADARACGAFESWVDEYEGIEAANEKH